MKSIDSLDWEKMNNLIPAIVQDNNTRQVLMLGYMDQAALKYTIDTGEVTFYSRSKQRIWTKGETSGNTLGLVDYCIDCDNDSILILAEPNGPTCHLGTNSCFSDKSQSVWQCLQAVIERRYKERPEASYTTDLFNEGIPRIAQKVGEEGVEVALAAALENKEELINEIADLQFHLLVLLTASDCDFSQVLQQLQLRAKG